MSAYLDKIMTNHVFNSESSEDLEHLYSEDNTSDRDNFDLSKKIKRGMKGGANESENADRPTGGFPPIFIITDQREKDAEKSKNRQLSSTKATISIKDILKSKK
ncbi:hypothetical protein YASMINEVIRUS_461 [Yasminevirus sp. GU-2018]|uniref:Uncharacterized protein n=1 Tax=Yasminevirus sp. GU-2018 TaxID=2420051 RepID=A0A5K0U7N8_9VIRU|nr:hypothetical protein YASMINEVIRUS_461 [Yasminevirus sp. GU-2018]